MNNQQPTNEALHVACEVCLKEIPHSDAKVSEYDDYVVNFCGLECYEMWHKEIDQQASHSKPMS